MENLTTTVTEVKYAGFWMRFVAFMIDSLVIKTAHAIIFTPLFVFAGMSSLVKFNMHPEDMDPTEATPLIIAIVGGALIAIMFSAIIGWLYFAIMESSNKQATLGKMALNLKVTDKDGNKISFGRATGRYFGKIVSGMILGIGYILAGVTEKKQALHDMMADCFVVKN